jgi:hypothetical protein
MVCGGGLESVASRSIRRRLLRLGREARRLPWAATSERRSAMACGSGEEEEEAGVAGIELGEATRLVACRGSGGLDLAVP